MNWTVLIFGGVLLLAMCHYWISGRHWFKGPRINVEHLAQIDTPGLRTTESGSQENEVHSVGKRD